MIGVVTTAGVLLVVMCALIGLVNEAGQLDLIGELGKPVTLSIIRFTFWQAALSTLLSIAVAIPLARALARRRHFFGRRLIIHLSSISLIIPSMVAVLGIVAVHGRNGWVNEALGVFGFESDGYLYGLTGILIAHVFFNLPLVTRILLNGLIGIPQHQWNLAAMYGMKSRHIFRFIEWPLVRGLLPGAAGLVFLLCFTSFAIVLTLGGGPKSTTLEVAIYQAIRFDFDLSRAVALSLIQIGICLLLATFFFSGRTPFPLMPGDYPGISRPDYRERIPVATDSLVILMAALFLLSPLAAILIKVLSSGGWSILRDPMLWSSLRWTMLIAISAGVLSCMMALSVSGLVVTLRHSARLAGWASTCEIIGVLTLLVPPITLGTGLFLFLRLFTDALSLGPLLVIAINAILTLAFGIRLLVPALQDQRERYDLLCQGLGIVGWHRWRLIMWPSLRQPITYALAIATAFSAGDMGVIALFGTDELSTLPLLMYRLIGNYRLEQAAVVAVLLCGLCFALFWAIEKLGDPPHA